ncbi:MAG TPA: hypothetical protein VGM60_10780 [Pseudonocardia sp.]|jgi:hypothetical protein|uniref:hypothetical protein n=1 Tax=Pseudonocardia sp. TaxID=60912 RepID=UPI002F3E8184
MPSAIDDLIGRTPVARPLLVALAVVVLLADAIVLVGYTGRVSGRAVPPGPQVRHPPSAVAPSAPSAAVPIVPSAPAMSAAPSAPAVPSRTASAPTGAAPRSPSAVRPTEQKPSGSGRSGDRWSITIPNPNDFTAKNPNSPFAQRCRDGQIEAWLCRGYPRQGN